MKIKVIKTEKEYIEALAYLEALGDREDFETSPALIDEFELISTLISVYDSANYPVGQADPIEVIQLKMDYMGLKRKDLAHIASSGVLSEVFNKKRALSKPMIRAFGELLHIDQDLLNTKYELVTDRKKASTKPKAKTKRPEAGMERPTFGFLRPDKKQQVERFKQRINRECMLLNISCAR